MNVKLPSKQWVDLYAVTGIVVGNVIRVTNMNVERVRLASTPIQPVDGDSWYPVSYRTCPVINNAGDLGAWAISHCYGGGTVDVQEV